MVSLRWIIILCLFSLASPFASAAMEGGLPPPPLPTGTVSTTIGERSHRSPITQGNPQLSQIGTNGLNILFGGGGAGPVDYRSIESRIQDHETRATQSTAEINQLMADRNASSLAFLGSPGFSLTNDVDDIIGDLEETWRTSAIEHTFHTISLDTVQRYNPEAINRIRTNISAWRDAQLNDQQRDTLELIDRYGTQAHQIAAAGGRTNDALYQQAQQIVLGAGFESLSSMTEFANRSASFEYQEPFDAATALLEIATSMAPGVSLVKDVSEFVSGHSAITGEKLSTMERAFAGLGIVTLGTSNVAKGGVKALGLIAKSAKNLGLAGKGIKSVTKTTLRIVGNGREIEASAAALRKSPGTAIISEALHNPEKMMRGTHNNAGLVPHEIAEMLTGREFRNFDQFRREFWMATSKSRYASEFATTPANLRNMRKGQSPFVAEIQMQGQRNRYELHHLKPIEEGGSVYDLSNIVVATPRYHVKVFHGK